jgi:hypothetical protein
MRPMIRVTAAILALAASMAPPLARADELADKSIITVPRSAGKFTLDKIDFDPAKPLQGLIATYSFPGAPAGVKIQLVLGPVGREALPPLPAGTSMYEESEIDRRKRYDQTVERLMNVELRQFQAATQDFKVGKPQDFFLERAPSFLVKPPARPNGVSRGLATAASFTHGGKQQILLTAAVYRDLFAIFVRSSVPGSTKEDANAVPFKEAIDTLVPLVDIRNFGACGNIEPAEGQTGGPYAMQANINRARDEGCAKDESGQQVPLPAGERRTFVYPKTRQP